MTEGFQQRLSALLRLVWIFSIAFTCLFGVGVLHGLSIRQSDAHVDLLILENISIEPREHLLIFSCRNVGDVYAWNVDKNDMLADPAAVGRLASARSMDSLFPATASVVSGITAVISSGYTVNLLVGGLWNELKAGRFVPRPQVARDWTIALAGIISGYTLGRSATSLLALDCDGPRLKAYFERDDTGPALERAIHARSRAAVEECRQYFYGEVKAMLFSNLHAAVVPTRATLSGMTWPRVAQSVESAIRDRADGERIASLLVKFRRRIVVRFTSRREAAPAEILST